MVSDAISQFKAIAAFIPKFTASSFSTGSVPGYPKSFGFTLAFGSLPKAFGLDENIFDFVFSSTWTSSPMTVSNFIDQHPLFPDAFYDGSSLAHRHGQHERPFARQNAFR